MHDPREHAEEVSMELSASNAANDAESNEPPPHLVEQEEVDRARARIIQRFPEFADYQWSDTYFDEDSEHTGIVAVFDHDWTRLANDFAVGMAIFPLLLSTGLFVWLCLFVLPDRFLSTIIQGTMFFISLCGIATCGTCSFIKVAYSELMLQLPPPPHSAVTAQGVLHVTGGEFRSSSVDFYFFPFSHLRDVSVETSTDSNERKTATDTCRLSLQCDLSVYRHESSATPPSMSSRTNRIRIRYLVDAEGFHRTVTFLKDGDVEG